MMEKLTSTYTMTKEREMNSRAFAGTQSMQTGRLFWMAVLILAAGGLPVTSLAAAKPMADFKGYNDPTLFTRLPHYYLTHASAFKESPFDAFDFSVVQGGKNVKQRVEGHLVKFEYAFDASAGAPPSPLQIIRNYQAAGAKVGMEMVFEAAGPGGGYKWTTLRLVKDGRETWTEIKAANGATYYLTIVEREAMKQDVIASTEALKRGLMQNGHVEVPGIFFDFNKADLKPESGPALEEIAKLLTAEAGVKVWVVGHTDYIGSADLNAALANARAAAVVKALVQDHGVDAKRLSSYGVGPYAPIATNATEEGRAKNRRVELVAKP
jgi:OmpA-OmpF porin, OOP family